MLGVVVELAFAATFVMRGSFFHVPCFVATCFGKDVPVSVDCGTPIGAQPEDDEPLQRGTNFDARFFGTVFFV